MSKLFIFLYTGCPMANRFQIVNRQGMRQEFVRSEQGRKMPTDSSGN